MAFRVSVVMPTHNRWGQLRRVLEGYRAQTIGTDAFEVLVCDDASTDETPERVREYAAAAPYALRFLRQEKKGPAAARNLGIAAATAPVVALTDDDCVPAPDLLARHLAATRPGVATIGYIDWHPEIAVTPFMDFLSPGYRFNFAQIADPQDASFRCFYTANVSAWRDDLLAVGGFDEGFPAAAYEDIELGYRLHRAGVCLVYDREAVIYHLHEMTPAGMLRSQLVNGRSAAHALAKHPELAVEAGVSGLRDPGTPRRFYRAALAEAFAAGTRGESPDRFAADWPPVGEALTPRPHRLLAAEERFFAAAERVYGLEDRLARLEADFRARAAAADRADRALRRANPIKNRLRGFLARRMAPAPGAG